MIYRSFIRIANCWRSLNLGFCAIYWCSNSALSTFTKCCINCKQCGLTRWQWTRIINSKYNTVRKNAVNQRKSTRTLPIRRRNISAITLEVSLTFLRSRLLSFQQHSIRITCKNILQARHAGGRFFWGVKIIKFYKFCNFFRNI